MSDVIVRKATEADLAELMSLLDDLPLTHQPATTDGAVFLRQIVAQEGRSLLVAEQGGALIGTVDLLIVPNLTHSGKPWAIVENMVVRATHRRRGIGRLLIQEAVGRAERAGCYKVQLLSNRTRREAHEFYQAVGFEASAEGFRRYLK